MTAQTCGISIAHGTDETVCVITYFLQVFLLTSWCLTSGYDNPVAAGRVSAAISVLYLESADAAIPVSTFAGYAFRSWLRHLFCGSGELDGCVPADPD